MVTFDIYGEAWSLLAFAPFPYGWNEVMCFEKDILYTCKKREYGTNACGGILYTLPTVESVDT